ncbi:MAG: hypothetical protein ACLRQF_21540 [Thomasclavelia ramosa]
MKVYISGPIDVDLMMEQGLLQEIDGLMKKNYTREMQSMKAIGYKEWLLIIRELKHLMKLGVDKEFS